MIKLIAVATVLVIAGCSSKDRKDQGAATPREPPPTAANQSAASPDPLMERLDALVAETTRREAALKQADLAAAQNRAAAAKEIPVVIEVASRAPSELTPAASAAAPGASVSSVENQSSDVKGEMWWKEQMRGLQVKLGDDLQRFDGAMAQAKMALDSMSTKSMPIFVTAKASFDRATAEANRWKAEANNDRAAIERLREDARRADVPPGWLRWP
jgi:hypothetical protein